MPADFTDVITAHDAASEALDARNEAIAELMSPEVGYTARQVEAGINGRLAQRTLLDIYNRLRPDARLARGRPPKQGETEPDA